MATIAGMLERVAALDLQQAAVTSIENTSGAISDLNAEQMSKGIKSDGNEITPPYSLFTIIEKLRAGTGLGKVTDRVTLFQTGAFYRGIDTSVKGVDVITTSLDSKTPDLVSRYGAEIFGLSAPFKMEYIREVLTAAYMAYIKDQLKL